MNILRNNDKEVFLVGTAHVSKVSAQQVREVIEQVEPDCIVLELCEERAGKLRDATASSGSGLDAALATLQRFGGGSRGGGVFEMLFRALYKIFEGLGTKPGEEFRVGLELAKKRNIPCVLGDRSSAETMARLQQNISLLDVMSMLTQPLPELSAEQQELFQQHVSAEDLVEKLKRKSFVRASVQLMRTVSPAMARILLDERDEILTDHIIKAPGRRIVAVVGMAHMEGIRTQWDKRT